VKLEISPEPTPLERAAIEAAVEQALKDLPSASAAWWEAGARENVETDDLESDS